MIILGIAGKARHGKDSIAEHLERQHGFFRMAFADTLRDMLDALPISAAYQTGIGKETVIPWIGRSYRQLMQTLGTEWGRELVSANLWLQVLARRIDATADVHDRVVISDVRFANEASWVRQRGQLWHVFRPGFPPIDGAGHVSEAVIEARPDEVFIMNNASLDHLREHVDIECRHLLGKPSARLGWLA